jgi:hypothetical protein
MNNRKAQLLQEIERTRLGIGRDFQNLTQELNLMKKASRVFAKKPFHWMAGSAALGFLLSGGLFRRKEKSAKIRRDSAPQKAEKAFGCGSALLTLLRMVFPLLKPALVAYASRKMAQLAERTR